MRILVVGATGYIGGRLVPRLLDAGHEVRCVARHPEKLSLRPWRHRVEVMAGDALDERSIKEAASGCEVAVYLVHSAATGRDFAAVDRTAAAGFRNAVESAGVRHVVFLGTLGSDTSRYVQSRHEVGRILREGSVPVTEIRAGTIIGSGSISFELLRGLTGAGPIQATPKWVHSRCQPIAVGDVLAGLVAAVDEPGPSSRVVDLAGPEVITYRDMMRIYADEAGLRRRRMIRLPFRLPRISALWIALVTPLPSRAARPLVDCLRADAVSESEPSDLPVDPMPYRAALRRTLARLPGGVITRWSDADSEATATPMDPEWAGGTVYMDRQVMPTETDPRHLYWAFSRIGGNAGYYGLDWAWRIRGLLDRLVGGVGLRRGRRHPTDVRIGEAIDCWRVEDVVPGRSLRLKVEMRLPGDAWLEWEIRPAEVGNDLIQTAWFRPQGLPGKTYWYTMLIPHRIVFPRMAHRIAAAAEERGFASR